MAGPVVLDESKVKLTSERIGGTLFGANNIHVHLWEGSGTPDHTDDSVSLVADDATFSGYTPQPVGAWGSPVLDATFHAISIGATVTFTNSGGSSSNPITGWWYEDNFTGRALLFGKFASPISIPAGQSFTFTPAWTGTGENLTS